MRICGLRDGATRRERAPRGARDGVLERRRDRHARAARARQPRGRERRRQHARRRLRVQLTSRLVLLLCGVAALPFTAAGASAQLYVEAASTIFHESGGPLSMTVIVPEVNAEVELGETLSLRLGWAADVVSG